MNVRKGMKRLAVFAGVLGAIAGGVASWIGLADLISTRARHKAFEQLATSDVVQQQRKLLTAKPISSLHPGVVVTPISPGSTEGWVVTDSPIPPPPPGFIPVDSEIDKGGIKTIHWTRDYGVESIDMQDGQTVFPGQAPSLWSYLLVVILPVLGFLIPWGLVNAMVWVGAGFIEASK
jgi:hypothetical protein